MNRRIRHLPLILLLAFVPALPALAQLSIERTISVGQTVADRGFYVSSLNWANTGIVDITDVNVQLTLSAAPSSTMRLGQMYATLTHGVAQESERVAVLLNRPGVTSANAFGSSLGSLDVWFDDSGSAANVFGITNSSGTYQADGRLGVDPFGTRVAYDAAQITAGLSALNGAWLESGTWSLLVADAQSGNRAEIDSWSLRVLGTAAAEGTVDPGQAATISVAGAGTQTFGAVVSSTGSGAGAVKLAPVNGAKLWLSNGLSGAGDFRKQGEGILRLEGVSSNFSGKVVVDSGEVQLASSGALGTSGRLEIAGSNAIVRLLNSAVISNAIVVSNGSTARLDGAGRLAGGITGGGGLVKEGVSTVTIDGLNTFTGATTVGGGLLVVNGSIESSAVTVQSGGTLGGSGTVGAVTVENGGTINPGNSPGTLNVNGDIDWLGGGNYNWQIVGLTGTAGTSSTWDLVSATGVLDLSALNIGSKFNINLWSLESTAPDVSGDLTGFDNTQNYTWKIATAAGGITGFNSSYFNLNTGANNGTGGFANALNGGSFSLAQSGNDLNLVFTADAALGAGAPVPEPGTWAAAALLVGAAGYVRWRKRAKVA